MDYNTCPNCNSKSGVDTKGRDFCHACGTNFEGNGRDLLLVAKRINSLPMPYADKNIEIPQKALDWMAKYHIKEKASSYCFWSPMYERLCFPINDFDGEQTGVNMRKIDGIGYEGFPGKHNISKWMFVGFKADSLSFYPSNKGKDVLVLVEDVISAIRVSEFYDCVSLNGTNANSWSLKSLSMEYKQIWIFLDGDEAGAQGAEKARNIYKMFHNIRILKQKKDPKEFNPKELEEILK